jgi:hypothetical protein
MRAFAFATWFLSDRNQRNGCQDKNECYLIKHTADLLATEHK